MGRKRIHPLVPRPPRFFIDLPVELEFELLAASKERECSVQAFCVQLIEAYLVGRRAALGNGRTAHTPTGKLISPRIPCAPGAGPESKAEVEPEGMPMAYHLRREVPEPEE